MQAAASPTVGTRHEPTEHERNIAKAALRDHAGLVAATAKNGRNDALNRESLPVWEICAAGWISEDEVRAAFREACFTNGLMHERNGAEDVEKTLNSARKKGFTQPRAPIAELPVTSTTMTRQGRANMTNLNGTRSAVLVRGIDIKEEPIQWLWKGYLPLGKFTVLAGDGGTGKSTVLFNFAATVTTGGLWPDGTRCKEPGNVLIWSSEDGHADTIKPRLMAAGADPYRYGLIDGTINSHFEKTPFDPARDMDTLRQAIRDIGGISLLALDPIVSAVAGDMHRVNDVRRSLQPIVDLATEFNTAVVGISHNVKDSKGKSAAQRVIGSQAFTGLPRMVLNTILTGVDEDTQVKQCILTRGKSNIAPEGGGFHFDVVPGSLTGTEIETLKIQWREPVRGTANAIMNREEADNEEDKHGLKLNSAMEFLRQELKDGPVAQSEIQKRYEQNGFSSATIKRARIELKIESRKISGSMLNGWEWCLPICSNPVR